MSALALARLHPLAGERDWFHLPSWLEVWQRHQLRPEDVPGVRELRGDASQRAPFPRIVHRTHLAQLGYEAPQDFGNLRDIAVDVAFTGCETSKTSLHFNIRPYQLDGIKFIRSRRGTCLFDEQRVGKSPQVMWSHEPEAGPLLVIAPMAARAVWHEWAARRFGACVHAWHHAEGDVDEECLTCARVGVVIGDRPSFMALSGRTFDADVILTEKPHVVFVHYALGAAWSMLFGALPEIGTLEVDEAQYAGIQNRKSISIEALRRLNTIAHRTVVTTGTPLYTTPKGLWPILDIVTPGAFGAFWDFARRWCDAQPTAHGWRADGASREDELRLRLGEVMLRRRWSDVKGDLPPLTRAVELVTIPQEKQDAVEELAARIRCAGGGARTAVGDLARLRKLYAMEKARAGIDVILRAIHDGHNCIGWVWHREVAEVLAKALREAGVPVYGPIDGDMHADERERLIEEARGAFMPRVLVATIASLATAVNLNFCSHEVFVELDWTPMAISQSEMRPYDGVQPVVATYLVADVAVERKLADALITVLETQQRLGLGAGVGDVRALLASSLGVGDEQTLDALAEACMAEAA